ncbi:cytochrome C [Phyllobacterium zundukense]|uniref:Cytochrome C n=2 Tax=Phyllobacterium zundukense TaxID=1867719 RepID=A0A2N9VPI8_9HYPH|nr:cytochrome c family protein [Phyllobacterium zundukense]ATU94802.1 cytochrome C [Phyllobacterium zundukense]PIO41406.1 cytochrome C [Phyllobacterium zundukense]
MRYSTILISMLAAILSVAGARAQDAGDAKAGEVVFKKCSVCHVADTDKNKVGPSLFKLMGRTAGTHPGFAYSPAMKEAGAAGLVWDTASLRDYLHDPKAKVKGTKMAFAGLKDDKDITNLEAYLNQFK